MKYNTSTIVKAVMAAVVALIGAASAAADGPDLSHIDFDQWLTAIGTAIVAGAALLHSPKKSGSTANSDAVATVTDVVAKAAEAHGQLVEQAIESIVKVQSATGELTKLLPEPVRAVENIAVDTTSAVVSRIPGLGPLGQQLIASVIPRF